MRRSRIGSFVKIHPNPHPKTRKPRSEKEKCEDGARFNAPKPFGLIF